MDSTADFERINGSSFYCDHSINKELKPLLIVFCTSGSVCCFLCTVAIIAMVLFRLFKLVTHRLILYMLVGILFFSLTVSIQFLGLWLKYWQGKDANECILEGFLLEYSVWVMLLSTSMMTLHLTVMVLFPSLYKRFAKIELFYLLFPWLFPLLVSWIPFVNHNYGVAGSWCWIRLYNESCSLNKEGMIEIYAVWYGELIIGLILNNIALVIIGLTLCKRAYIRNTTSLAYRKALKQTLPLLAYPITYQILSIFAIANRLYQAFHSGHDVKWMFYAHAATAPSWGLFAPIFTFIYFLSLHKVISKNLGKWSCCKKRVSIIVEEANNFDSRRERKRLIDPSDHLTRYGVTVTYPTGDNFRTESEVDEEFERLMSSQTCTQ